MSTPFMGHDTRLVDVVDAVINCQAKHFRHLVCLPASAELGLETLVHDRSFLADKCAVASILQFASTTRFVCG